MTNLPAGLLVRPRRVVRRLLSGRQNGTANRAQRRAVDIVFNSIQNRRKMSRTGALAGKSVRCVVDNEIITCIL